MSSLRFKTRRVFHLTSRDWFSLVSSWRMAELCLTTTSKRNPPCTWSWDWEVVSLSHLWKPWLPSTTVKSLFAVNVTLDCHLELPTAERESVVTPTSCAQRRSWNDLFRIAVIKVYAHARAWACISLNFFLCTHLSNNYIAKDIWRYYQMSEVM